MRRLFAIAASVAILLLAFAPAAFAAEPVTWSGGGTIISVEGNVDVPAGQSVDAVVVVRGTATIEGSARSIVVISGTATLTGASARNLLVVDGTANLGAGTTISGNVSTLHGDVVRDATAVVTGRTTSLDTNLAALAFALVPLLIVLTVGFFVAMVVAGLALAAFGARQTRTAEAMISREPGQVLLAGLIGTLALPVLFGIVTLTVVGAPIGLAMLLIGLPLLAFVGWLVAAVWVGDWLLGRRGSVELEHPYRAAVLGVVVLGIAGVLPLVSAIATLFGAGAILLAAWRSIRPASPAATMNPGIGPNAGWSSPAPTAG
ncbi:MAG TPA: hypothetical protein VIR16_03450 [Candidatus Limnocylindrales bacterium]